MKRQEFSSYAIVEIAASHLDDVVQNASKRLASGFEISATERQSILTAKEQLAQAKRAWLAFKKRMQSWK